MVRYNTEHFLWVARGLGYQLNGERRIEKYEGAFVFRSIFGIDPSVCSFVYRLSNAKAKGITSNVHTDTFDIDEAALELSIGLMAWLAIKELEFEEKK